MTNPALRNLILVVFVLAWTSTYSVEAASQYSCETTGCINGTCHYGCGAQGRNLDGSLGAGYMCWCDDGCLAYRDCCFDKRYQCNVPTITTISPILGDSNGGTTLTVSGNNFNHIEAEKGIQGLVQLHNGPESNKDCAVIEWQNAQIKCTIPAGVGKDWQVYVETQFEVFGEYPQNTLSSPSLVWSYNKPTISSVTPSSGTTAGNTRITIAGTSLGNALGSVTVGGSNCPVHSQSHASIICDTPAGTGLSKNVIVTVASQTSNVVSYSYSAPSLSSISPTSGSTAGSTTITVTGSNLGNSAGAISVTIGGQTCTSVTVVTAHSKISCRSPVGQGVNIDLRVTVSGQTSNALLFSYSAPSISTVSPSTGPTAGGISIELTGTSLGTSGTVTIGGTTASVTSHTHTRIQLSLPAGQGVALEVKAIVSGQSSNTKTFSYSPPTVTGVSTASGYPTAGSVPITVAGTNFGSSGVVFVNGVSCPGTGTASHTSITCTLPAGEGVNLPVTVKVLTQTSSITSQSRLSYDAPAVSTALPATAPTQGGGNFVVTGSNFGSSGEVFIGTFQCFPSAWAHDSITCGLPAGQGTGLAVKVSVSGQNNPTSGGSAKFFSYNAPTASSLTVTPTTGNTQGGTPITIGGDNFGQTPAVTVGGASCTTTSVTASQIVCTLPVSPNLNNPLDVGVTAVGHTVRVAPTKFSYNNPQLTSVAPDRSTSAGGVTLTLTGTSFGSGGGSVRVGGKLCTITQWSHTSIKCTVPAGQGRGLDVVITSAAALSSATGTFSKFDYDPPVLTSLSPTEAVTAGTDTLFIYGSSFGVGLPDADLTVTVGGKPCSVSYRQHTEVRCSIPEGAGSSKDVKVTVDGQESSPLTFSYSQPNLVTVAPSHGPTPGSTLITLTGTSLGQCVGSVGDACGVSSVTINGAPCAIQSHTHTQATCLTPTGTGTSNPVIMTVAGLTTTSSLTFSYDQPVVSFLIAPQNPTAGQVLATLIGTNFGQDASAVTVLVGAKTAIVSTSPAPNNTAIVFTLPEGQGVALDVSTTVGGQISNSVPFSYAAPEIASVDGIVPASGNTTGGTRVTITGTNFGETPTVTIGGQDCTESVITKHTRVVCTLPAGSGSGLDAIVTVDTRSSPAKPFSYIPPSIVTLSTNLGNTQGGEVLTIKGYSFGSTGSVKIGAYNCFAIVNGWSDNQIECTIPEGEGKDLLVSITVDGQTSSTTPHYFSYNPPNIGTVSPSQASTASGSTLTIQGTNFGVTEAYVLIGDVLCPVSSHAHNQLICLVPAGRGTGLDVSVKTPGYPAVTVSAAFSYDGPTLNTITPTTARTAGGSILTLKGASFDMTGSVNVSSSRCVVFDPPVAQFDFESPTVSDTALNPAGSAWTFDANSGIARCAGGLTQASDIRLGELCPPLGVQAAALHNTSVVYQDVSGFVIGQSYFISLRMWARPCCGDTPEANDLQVQIRTTGDAVVATVLSENLNSLSNPFTVHQQRSSSLFTATATTLRIRLATTNPSGKDTTTFVDLVRVLPAGASWDHSTITCVVPPGEGIQQDVQMHTPLYRYSTTKPLNYLPPILTAINPSRASTDGTTVAVVSGDNFGLGSNTALSVGGIACQSLNILSHTSAECQIPVGQGDSKLVSMTVDGQTSNNIFFAYSAPQIVSIHPPSGNTKGGDQVRITGTSLGTSGAVTIGGKACLVTSNTHTHTSLNCSTPPGQGTNLEISVTVEGQPSTSLVTFSYDPPFIDTIAPSNGPTTGGYEVVLTGKNFGVSGAIVQIGGTECVRISQKPDGTEYRCTMPAGTGVSNEVLVTVGSLISNPKNFAYDPPTITSINPLSADTSGGTNLQITGTNLGTSGSGAFATIGGKTCSPTIITHTSLTCLTPEGQGVLLPVVVVVASQQSSELVYFNYSAPNIQSVTPLVGPTAGGITLTLEGTSFGINPTVTVGGLPCQLAQSGNTHARVTCTLPEGMGTNKEITLQQNGGVSGTFINTFSYNRPVVLSVTPEPGPTSGDVLVIIVGNNFGTSGSVTIGGSTCVLGIGSLWDHDRVECTLPAGKGISQSVIVTTASQTNTFFGYAYAAPSIDRIAPTLGSTDTSGYSIEMFGNNFGCKLGQAVPNDVNISFSGADIAPEACNHTYIRFVPLSGTGQGKSISVTVATQTSNAVSTFSFLPPTLTSVSGCDGDAGSEAKLCPVNGGKTIVLTGNNFGATVGSARVYLDGVEITPVTMPTPHTQLSFALPAGVGFSLPVRVDVDGQTVSQNWLSYVHPEIEPNTLKLAGVAVSTGNVSVNSVSGGQRVNFTGKYIGTDTSKLWISYGASGDPTSYNCTNIVVIQHGTSDSIECDLAAGVGADLVFRVVVFLSGFAPQISAEGVDTVSYPKPTITPNTLRSQFGTESSKLQGTSSAGQIILFRGTNFGTDPSKISVFYGPAANVSTTPPGSNTFKCLSVSLPSPNQVQCTTAQGDGENLVFRVLVLNQYSAIGNDTYDYPKPPAVTAVSGCSVNDGTTTSNCPTAGGTEITIDGSSFASQDITVKIGSGDCRSFKFVSSTQIKCTLPEGTGFNQQVVVYVGLLFSIGRPFVSYAPPALTGVSSTACVNDPGGEVTSRCPRNGGVPITLTGSNFGATNAIVLIGGSTCSNVIHSSTTPHSQLTCTLPAGGGLTRAIFIVQGEGEPSQTESNVKLSYKPCPAGTAEDATPGSVACINCEAGSYTAEEGQQVCLPCEAGFYTNQTAMTACLQCDAGQKSGAGASNCTDCPPGTFTQIEGQAECTLCDAGRFSNESRATTCRQCSPGTFLNAAGLSVCAQCDPGYYSNTGSLICEACAPGRVTDGTHPCTDCPRGRFQANSAGSECIKCASGTAINSAGQAACSPCESGFFANATELLECFKCPAGRFSQKTIGALVGPSSCSQCTPGSYIDAEGQGGCLSCAKGTVVNVTGATSCELCQVGTVSSLEGGRGCTACDPGYFASSQGLAECQACELGRFSNKSAASTCQYCSAGYFQSTRASSSCLECPSDSIARVNGQPTCITCPLGTFAANNGSTLCVKCDAGTFKEGAFPVGQCGNCVPGSYAPTSGQGACTLCDPGTYSTTHAATTCLECPRGFIANQQGATRCEACSTGRFASLEKSVSCEICLSGTYQPSSNATSCITCPAGRANSVPEASECTICQPGQFQPEAGQQNCLSCPVGQFSNVTLATSCHICPPGHYQSSAGATKCFACTTGTYVAVSGQSKCIDCPQGTYAGALGSTVCTDCGLGTAASSVRSAVCANCTAGRYAAAKGSVLCQECPQGSFSAISGASACVNCVKGQYQSQTGQTECLFCDQGRYSPADSQAFCTSCAPGAYNNDSATRLTTTCDLCAPGAFNAKANAAVCTLCSPGSISTGNASLSCDSCDAGSFSSAYGSTVCQLCEEGTYQNAAGQSKCLECLEGQFMGSVGQLLCLPCTSGKFASSKKAQVCTDCPAGEYSVKQGAGSTGPRNCTQCAPGKYLSVSGQSACVACDAGSFTNTTGATSCTRCPRGKFLAASGGSVCTACNPGYFAATDGLTGCEPCPIGKISATGGADTCVSCPSGSYAPQERLTICSVCNPGEFTAISGQQSCLQCPAGKKSGVAGSSNCTSCEPGKFTRTYGASSCTSCPSGTFASLPGQAACISCGVGTYAASSASTVCTLCAPGTFIDATDASTCKECPAGRSAELNGTVVCSDCQPGTYADQQGLTKCKQCSPGSFGPSQQLTTCLSCPDGKYAPAAESLSCLDCSAGFYSNGSNPSSLASCTPCAPGTFTSARGQGNCTACPLGEFAPASGSVGCGKCSVGTYAGGTGQSACASCQPGTYMPLSGASVCLNCANGTSQSNVKQVSCDPCASGKFANVTGQSVCNLCNIGSSSNADQYPRGPTECTACVPGKYMPFTGKAECVFCPAGTFMNATGGSSCLACPPGRFSGSTGFTECTVCDVGTYASISGSVECLLCPRGRASNRNATITCDTCPPGRVQSQDGQPVCDDCPPGRYGSSNGSVACLGCNAGNYQPVPGQSSCDLCPSGTYSATEASRVCLNCTVGRFNGEQGQVSCLTCPLGTSNDLTGQTACAKCKPGYFQDLTNQTTCKPCAVGKYVNVTGQIGCLGCPVGKYADVLGLDDCKLCNPGTYEVRVNSTSCLQCDEGTYAPAPGALGCVPCDWGSFANTTGLSKCHLCEFGKFQNTSRNVKCDGCPAGRFTDNLGASSCIACQPGWYNPNTTQGTCTRCPRGYFGNLYGQTSCQICPEKTFSDVLGQTICSNCPPGRFGDSKGLIECENCPLGRSVNEFGASVCDDCIPGRFAGTTGQTSCQACPVATYQNAYGQRNCTFCPVGTANERSNQTTCVDCVAGRHSPAVGQRVCSNCPVGKFSNDTGFSACLLCGGGRIAPSTALTVCESCVEGRFAASTGQSYCLFCSAGLYTDRQGQSGCQRCQAGTISARAGATNCTSCEIGSFAGADGLSKCEPCSPGRVNNITQQSTCIDCNKGQFQNSSGASACFPCTPGTFASLPGTSVCLSCEATSFAAQFASTSCTPCPAGTFQPSQGASACLNCTLGKFTSAQSQARCVSCEAGRISTITGATICEGCTTGRFANSSGSSRCYDCGIGSFAGVLGSVACDSCPTGRFSNMTSLSVCLACPSGKFMSEQGATLCDLCSPGTFTAQSARTTCSECAIGFKSSVNGSSSCTACLAGRFSSQTRGTTCAACDVGFEAPGNASASCTPCAAGRFTTTTATKTCTACVAGSDQRNLGSTTCTSCPAGYEAPSPGTQQCQRCQTGSIAAKAGTVSCIPCDTFSSSNANRTVCLCDPGFYDSSVFVNNATRAFCTPCPKGADCDAQGVTFSTMGAEACYWRDGYPGLEFIRCQRCEHCAGGLNSTCLGNRDGPLCALCQKGYHTIFGGECIKCPEKGGSWLFLVGVSLLGCLLYAAMMWVVVRGGRDLLNKESESARRKIFYGGGEAELVEVGAASQLPEDDKERAVKLKSNFLIQRPAEFMFKMKIMLTFLQVISNMAISLEVPWPTAFKEFISFFSILNIDFVQASSANCVVDATFYPKYIVVTLAPVMILSAIALFYVLPRYYFINKKSHAELVDMGVDPLNASEEIVAEVKLQRKRVRRNFWKMAVFTLFLLYPLVSSTIMRLYVCKNVSGVDYLQADFSIQCYDSRWNSYATYGAFMILLYCAGIPAFFFYMLWRYFRYGRLQEPGVRAELGFIYDAYDYDFWWFEMVDMLHKFVVTSMLAFFPNQYPYVFGLIVVLGYAIVLLLAKPYKRKGDDKLHLLVQSEIFLFIYAGYLFFQDIDTDSNYDIIMSVVMIGICCGLMLYLFGQVIWVLRRRYKNFREERDIKNNRRVQRRRNSREPSMFQNMELARTTTRRRSKEKHQLELGGLVKMERNPLQAKEFVDVAGDTAGDDTALEGNVGEGNLFVNPLFGALPVPADDSRRGSSMELPAFEDTLSREHQETDTPHDVLRSNSKSLLNLNRSSSEKDLGDEEGH